MDLFDWNLNVHSTVLDVLTFKTLHNYNKARSQAWWKASSEECVQVCACTCMWGWSIKLCSLLWLPAIYQNSLGWGWGSDYSYSTYTQTLTLVTGNYTAMGEGSLDDGKLRDKNQYSWSISNWSKSPHPSNIKTHLSLALLAVMCTKLCATLVSMMPENRDDFSISASLNNQWRSLISLPMKKAGSGLEDNPIWWSTLLPPPAAPRQFKSILLAIREYWLLHRWRNNCNFTSLHPQLLH